MFFDRHPRFLDTSKTGSSAARLNRRHAAIIGWNAHLFPGARVLDVASHDGRWSAAALDAGAEHVIAIEARANLVENARATFEAEGLPESRCEFRNADVFEELKRDELQVDLVLLLGFFYHVSNHVELAGLVARTGARHVVLDTGIVADVDVSPRWSSMIGFRREDIQQEWNRYTSDAGDDRMALAGYPSRGAVADVFDHFGYTVEEYDWRSDLAMHGPHPDLKDYVEDRRATFRLTRMRP